MKRLPVLAVALVAFGVLSSLAAPPEENAEPAPKAKVAHSYYDSAYAKRAAQASGLTIEEYRQQDLERRRQRAKAAAKRRREATVARARMTIEFSEQHMSEDPEYAAKNIAKAKRMIAEAAREEGIAAREETIAAARESRQAAIMRPGLLAPIFPFPSSY